MKRFFCPVPLLKNTPTHENMAFCSSKWSYPLPPPKNVFPPLPSPQENFWQPPFLCIAHRLGNSMCQVSIWWDRKLDGLRCPIFYVHGFIGTVCQWLPPKTYGSKLHSKICITLGLAIYLFDRWYQDMVEIVAYLWTTKYKTQYVYFRYLSTEWFIIFNHL